jgi:transposase
MTEAPGTIVRGFRAELYPTAKQADRLNQWAGSLRFLWNRLLEAEQASKPNTPSRRNPSPRPNCDAVPSL